MRPPLTELRNYKHRRMSSAASLSVFLHVPIPPSFVLFSFCSLESVSVHVSFFYSCGRVRSSSPCPFCNVSCTQAPGYSETNQPPSECVFAVMNTVSYLCFRQSFCKEIMRSMRESAVCRDCSNTAGIYCLTVIYVIVCRQ